MLLNEPSTLITDFAMGAAALTFTVLLVKRLAGQDSRAWWVATFALTGLASFVAGFYHGFKGIWPDSIITSLDIVTVLAMIGVSFCFLLGTARSLVSRKYFDMLFVAALIKTVFFIIWNVTHRVYLYVIADYAPALLAVAVFSIWRWGKPASRWLVAGMAISVFGALVQQLNYDPVSWFNHNDVYHVIQIAGLYLFFRGAILLRDGQGAKT